MTTQLVTRAVTLWQPWASAIAVGAKMVETRSWETSWRGPVAIHAAKRPVSAMPSSTLLHLTPHLRGVALPLGCVIAVAQITGCHEMNAGYIAAQTEKERALGDWQPGRFAWTLADIRPLQSPLPTIGRQRVWRLNREDSLEIARRLR